MGIKSAYEAIHFRARLLVWYVNHGLEFGYGKLGRLDGRHPIIVALVTGCIAGALAFGLFAAHFESRPEKLWVPGDARTPLEKDFYDSHYGPFYRTQQMIFTATNEQQNVYTKAALLELVKLENMIYNLTATYEGQPVRITDICYRTSPQLPCVNQTVLDSWYNKAKKIHDPAMINADADIWATFDDVTTRTPQGAPIYPFRFNVVSPQGMDLENKKLRALLVTILVNNTQDDNDRAIAWEHEFLDMIKAYNESLGADPNRPYNMWWTAEISLTDELGRMIAADSVVIGLCYLIMAIYVSLAIGNFHWVRGKVVMGFAGVLVIVLAIVCGFGVASIFGVDFSSISAQVVPFLILATGLDDMFIIINSYNDVEEDEEGENPKCYKDVDSKEVWQIIEDRTSKALAHAGPCLTLSQGCNFLAMMVGSATTMPAMRMFSYQAAICVISVLVLELTLLASLNALDAYRVMKSRMDVLCCVTCKPKEVKKEGKVAEIRRFLEGRILHEFNKRYYTKILFKIPVSLVVILIFAGVLGVCIWGTTNMEMGLGESDAIPEDSYLLPFNDRRSYYFGNMGAPLYMVYGKVDYTDPAIRATAKSIQEQIPKSHWTQTGVISWMDDFYLYCKQVKKIANSDSIPANKFYSYLKEFLHDNSSVVAPLGLSHQGNVVWDTDGTILTSRVYGFYIGLNTTYEYVDALKDTWHRVERKATGTFASKKTGLPTFGYSTWQVFFEEYTRLWDEVVQNLLGTLAVVFVLGLIVLGSPTGAFIIMILLGIQQVDILGFLKFWGVAMNPLVVVNLCIVTGLCVEFTSVVVWASMGKKYAKMKTAEKSRWAITEMGPNVTGGAISTLVGICALAFAEYKVFRVQFFRLYLIALVVAYLHSVVLLPLILRVVAPESMVDPRDKDSVDEETGSKDSEGSIAPVPLVSPSSPSEDQTVSP